MSVLECFIDNSGGILFFFNDMTVDLQDHFFCITEYLRDLLRGDMALRYHITKLCAVVMAEDMRGEVSDPARLPVFFRVRLISVRDIERGDDAVPHPIITGEGHRIPAAVPEDQSLGCLNKIFDVRDHRIRDRN